SFGMNEQVLEIDSRLAQERRIVMEEQGEALGHAVDAGKHHFGIGTRTEKRLAKAGFCGYDLVLEVLIFRQRTNKPENSGNVLLGGGADGDGDGHEGPQPVLCNPCAMPVMLASNASNRSR